MKKIYVISSKYCDGSGYSIHKAYSETQKDAADADLEINQSLNHDRVFRLTEIPFQE